MLSPATGAVAEIFGAARLTLLSVASSEAARALNAPSPDTGALVTTIVPTSNPAKTCLNFIRFYLFLS